MFNYIIATVFVLFLVTMTTYLVVAAVSGVAGHAAYKAPTTTATANAHIAAKADRARVVAEKAMQTRSNKMSLLQPAAPLTLWCDEPNWWDGVEPAVTPEEMLAKLAALEMNTPVEDDHALVWYPDENHWE